MKYQILGAVLALSVVCVANAQTDANSQLTDTSNHKLYFGIEGGYSSSLSSNLDVNETQSTPTHGVWDHPLEGWNTKMGSQLEYGLAVGYNVCDLVSLELLYNNRPSFNYVKGQTVPNSSLGDRTRYFDLANQTLMINGVFHMAAMLDVLQNFKTKTNLEPFVDVGMGLAKNTISNFHTISTTGAIYSKMLDKTSYSLAAQVGIGIDYDFTKNWSMKAGYRFVFGGKFNTQDYITDDPGSRHTSVPGSGTIEYPWSGKLRTNEVYLSVNYTM